MDININKLSFNLSLYVLPNNINLIKFILTKNRMWIKLTKHIIRWFLIKPLYQILTAIDFDLKKKSNRKHKTFKFKEKTISEDYLFLEKRDFMQGIEELDLSF